MYPCKLDKPSVLVLLTVIHTCNILKFEVMSRLLTKTDNYCVFQDSN